MASETLERLRHIAAALNQPNGGVLVIGDACADILYRVDGLHVHRELGHTGMVGSVSAAVARCSPECDYWCLETNRNAGIRHQIYRRRAGDHKWMRAEMWQEIGQPPTAREWQQMWQAIMGQFPPAATPVSVVLLCDHGSGILDGGAASDVISLAQEHGAAIIVDPAYGRPWTDYVGCTAIKATVAKQAATTSVLCPGAAKIITQADYGAWLVPFSDTDSTVYVPSAPIPDEGDAYDPCYSGDVMMGAIGACLACGLTLHDGVLWGAWVAAINCAHVGCFCADVLHVLRHAEAILEGGDLRP